jgi:hypothetical protein
VNDDEGHVDPGVGIALALDTIREKAVEAAAAIDWRDVPFPRGDTTFMIFLTAEEWELCYSLSFAWIDQGELKMLPLAEQFRAVIHRIETEFSYRFEGVRTGEDRELYARVRKPVEPNNILSIMMLQGGSPPEYELHLMNAADFCRIRGELSTLVPLLDETIARVRIALEKSPRPSKKEKKELRERMKFEQRAAEALRERIMTAENMN